LPIVVISLLTALFGVMYLGYVVDPEKHLEDFPVVLVDQDVGDVVGEGEDREHVNYGNQIADALRAGIPEEKVDLRTVGSNEADRQLREGKAYGAIIIPSDFSKRLGTLGVGSVVPGDIERPVITVQTNPRAGPYSAQIVHRISDRAMALVNQQVGAQLTDQVNQQLAPEPGAPPSTEISGAARLALAEPVNVINTDFHPLPGGTGQGLSAFFYALLLLLAGTIGAMTIHSMVDGVLGFAPTEYGPKFVHFTALPISRFRGLLVKWGLMVLAAVLVALVYLSVAELLNMPIERPGVLFFYSVLAVAAVGVTGLSVLAIFGSLGLLVNLIVFVVLGLPSSGGTVPIEATPGYLRWLAEFEPMHQVYLAVRSILYYGADFEAGLGRGVAMTLLGLGIGLVLGAVVTWFYDHKGLHRRDPEREVQPA